LERRLAEFFGKPAALVFSTGYQANVGTLSALLAPGDLVFADKEAHASVIDGCRLAGADLRLFAHNDVAHLRGRLAKAPAGTGRLVVVDGVYSMGGDICPLPEIADACAEFGARLVVDDAHGAGVLAAGRGTSAMFGLTDRVDLITLTFSKAFASLGGAVLGSEEVIHYLRHHARSQIFSASITPSNAAAALTALEIVAEEPWRCERALANARYVATELRGLGLDVGASDSPIVPVLTGDVANTVVSWRRLLDLGVYTNAILPPAASPRLRTSFMATHQQHHLDRAIDAFATLADPDTGLLASRAA
jgi:7-keto-8-aminopelargonate synthetase-like enzyme